MIGVILRYFHTVRYLKLSQIGFRLIKLVLPNRSDWFLDNGAKFRHVSFRLPFLSRANDTFCCLNNAEFHFLNRIKVFGKIKDIDWDCYEHDGLWLDNLHYFRFLDGFVELLENDVERLEELVDSWVEHVSSNQGSKALNPPYNASERVFSIGRFLLSNPKIVDKAIGNKLVAIAVSDLNFVASNLEWHLLGNHLLKNLLSLAWGACLFDSATRPSWEALVDKRLPSVLAEQIGPDGMHYELSPMYHNNALLDLLDILNLRPANEKLSFIVPVTKQMLGASQVVTHCDGDIAFFNDCSLNNLPSSQDILAYGKALCGPITSRVSLPDSGFYRMWTGQKGGLNLIARCGRLGPNEQMGHVHNDLLSFELCLGNDRIFVNSGTSTYHLQPTRSDERAERAHNTVCISGAAQSELWSGFRVARRSSGGENTSFEYDVTQSSLSSTVPLVSRTRLQHRREFRLFENSLEIEDRVLGNASHAVARFILASDLYSSVERVEATVLRICLLDGRELVLEFKSPAKILDGLASQYFNAVERTKVIEVPLNLDKNGTLSLQTLISSGSIHTENSPSR